MTTIDNSNDGIPIEKVIDMYNNIIISVSRNKKPINGSEMVLKEISRYYNGCPMASPNSIKSIILKKNPDIVDIDMNFLNKNQNLTDIANKALKNKDGSIRIYNINEDDLKVLNAELPDNVWVKGGEKFIDGSGIEDDWAETNLTPQVLNALGVKNPKNDNEIIARIRYYINHPPQVTGTPNLNIDGIVKELSRMPEFMNKSHEEKLEFFANKGIGQDFANKLIDRMENEYNRNLTSSKLLRSELKENDIERLQSQTQRDFDEKLRNQNLRYILPAMVERREKVIAHRLNPELLKGAFAI